MFSESIARVGHKVNSRVHPISLPSVLSALALLASSFFVPSQSAALSREADPSEVEAALVAAGAITADTGAGGRETQFHTDSPLPATLTESGLQIESNAGILTMAPVAVGEATSLGDGAVMFQHPQDSAIALTTSERGANAGYSVLLSENAPREYSYRFTIDGEPAILESTEAGGIAIFSPDGEIVNLIAPAWAVDANGVDVPTNYTIFGNTITQTIHLGADVVYPVVADPRLMCDGLWCTVELSRADTAAVADNALNAGILCTFIPSGGAAACAAVVVGAWAHANIARSNGLCSGYRVWQQNLISFGHLVYITCYA